MAEQMKDIQIEEIMQEIRETIKTRGYREEDTGFVPQSAGQEVLLHTGKGFDAADLDTACANAGSLHKIEYYQMIPAGGAKSFIQRAIRRVLKYLLQPFTEQQSHYNYNVYAALRQVQRFAGEQNAQMDQLDAQMDQMDARMEELQEQVRRQLEQLAADQKQLAADQEALAMQQGQLAAQQAQLSMQQEQFAVRMREQAQKEELLAFRQRQLQEKLTSMQTAGAQEMSGLPQAAGSRKAPGAAAQKPSGDGREPVSSPAGKGAAAAVMPKTQAGGQAPDAYASIDYFDFENHFRGDRQLIKDRQRMYLPYFKGRSQVIDIGSGRGEFLELLTESGIGAVGVDNYPEFAEYCRQRGLTVVCADGNAYLQSVTHTDGIFAGQIVEHMTVDQIVQLCTLAYEKLTAGSYLIIETPNPTSLAIYTRAFYMDPSHVKPVHPLTMEYLLTKAGFTDVHTIYTECSRTGMEIPPLAGEHIENLDAFNAAMHEVSETLYGSQDYAVIARR